MFADACRTASEFTHPVVTSVRRVDGTVQTSVGSFIVLNRDGWVLTAGHAYDSFVKFRGDAEKIKEIEELNRTRENRPGSPSSMIKLDPEFLTNHSFWWGWDGLRLNTVTVNRQLDIAVGKLEPFDPSLVSSYPVLADPSDAKVGTSLCRGGFAFSRFSSRWNDDKKAFEIPSIDSRSSVFFNDCILCRVRSDGPTFDRKYDLRYIETSTPGIKGQSGGPIFDRKGRLIGMQVRTDSIDLGFQPTAEMDGRTVVENQFINIGIGLHISVIRSFLDDLGVSYDSDGDEGFRIVG